MDDSDAESLNLNNENQQKRSPKELFDEILKSLEEYTSEKVEVLLKNKSKFLSILKTHRPLKTADYHYGLSENLLKDRALIVFEFDDKRMVRQYYKHTSGKNIWRCLKCKRLYINQLRSSITSLYLINGILLVPLDHDCTPRDAEIVMQYQKFLEEGNMQLARRMTQVVSFNFGESSLAYECYQ
uniref:Uncharacterized protein n=1 Tax=Panagrolaimus sp. ES5 TaxID=591445 RepID=A0AC34F1D4_9BILA